MRWLGVPLAHAPVEMADAQAETLVAVAGTLIGDHRTPPARYVSGRKRGPDRNRAPGEKRQRICKGCGSTGCPGRWRVDNCTA